MQPLTSSSVVRSSSAGIWTPSDQLETHKQSKHINHEFTVCSVNPHHNTQMAKWAAV